MQAFISNAVKLTDAQTAGPARNVLAEGAQSREAPIDISDKSELAGAMRYSFRGEPRLRTGRASLWRGLMATPFIIDEF